MAIEKKKRGRKEGTSNKISKPKFIPLSRF